MSDDGHKYTHGPPKGGWPIFKDGKRVKEEEADTTPNNDWHNAREREPEQG